MRLRYGLVNQVTYCFCKTEIMSPFKHLLCPNTAFAWTDELEEACKQRDRIIDSKVVSSEQLADMSLMY